MESSYLRLYRSGDLQERVKKAVELLRGCHICPHKCGSDRAVGELGLCNTGLRARVSSYAPHFGEEQPLVGTNGSGTIFFTHCNLMCTFCQNFDISQCSKGEGIPLSDEDLANIMIELQNKGCHNINFVTPGHVVPQILSALISAVEKGLTVPLVFNSNGYDAVETLELLNGVVDIYMPDFKFWKPESSVAYTNASDYPEVARNALKEMHRQVGDLVIDDAGLAQSGLLVRHLVMPGQVDESKRILGFIKDQISDDTYMNIMDQYRPVGKAHESSKINRSITTKEYNAVVDHAKKIGLKRLDERDLARMLQMLLDKK